MSRVASNPILLPDGVELKIEGRRVTASGKMGDISAFQGIVVNLISGSWVRKRLLTKVNNVRSERPN